MRFFNFCVGCSREGKITFADFLIPINEQLDYKDDNPKYMGTCRDCLTKHTEYQQRNAKKINHPRSH